MGQRAFDTLCHTDEVMGMALALRNELKLLDSSAHCLQDGAEMLQPSLIRVAKVMFGRSAFAFRRQRWYFNFGVILRNARVSVLVPEDASAQDWISPPFVGGRPFPITRDGRLRNCAALGFTKCKRRLVMIVRGITKLARRLLDSNKPDSVRLLPVFRAQKTRVRFGVFASQ